LGKFSGGPEYFMRIMTYHCNYVLYYGK